MRCSWEAPRLPSLIFSCPRARPPAQPRQRRDLLEERLDRQRRRPADFLTRWDIAHHAALSRNTGPSAKRQMTGNTGLARQDNMIVKPGATGNSCLRDHNAAGTKVHVVPDLNQIIDHGAAANDRVRTSAAIDRGVRTDLHVVFDDHSAELRNPHKTGRIHGKTETILPDPYPGIDADPVADQTMAERGAGPDHSVIANHDLVIDHRIRGNPATPTDLHAGTDNHAGSDFGSLADSGCQVDHRCGSSAGPWRRLGIECLSGQSVGFVGRSGQQQRHAGRCPMSQIRMDKTGASLTGGEGIDIFPVVEKTDLRRSSGATSRIRSDGATSDASSALVMAARCSSV